MIDDPGDDPAYLTEWLKATAAKSWRFQPALDKLKDAGCDPLKLAWLLVALANARGWKNISRDDAKKIAADLREAARGLRQLFFSQLQQVLQINSRQLEGKLAALADRADELTQKIHARRPMGQDLV